jgi:hypothetical protein
MHAVLVGLAAAAIVVYVIGRQLMGEALRGKRLIVLPAVLAVIGELDLNNSGQHPRPIDIVCIVISGVIVAGIGLAQGRMMRLESRDGVLWAQMPAKGLWLWLTLVVSRLAMSLLASGVHAHVAASSAPILLLLGVNRLSQAAIVAPRAFTAGVPFAPEKDGQTFLAGMFAASPSHQHALSAVDHDEQPVGSIDWRVLFTHLTTRLEERHGR